ncbi:hypothetical protein [Gemmatimonas sp.]|uniref:hypothetical protein n=1 Tax=Gemmatimonas sp. TaxID=1962908 RepID=UPI003563E6D7
MTELNQPAFEFLLLGSMSDAVAEIGDRATIGERDATNVLSMIPFAARLAVDQSHRLPQVQADTIPGLSKVRAAVRAGAVVAVDSPELFMSTLVPALQGELGMHAGSRPDQVRSCWTWSHLALIAMSQGGGSGAWAVPALQGVIRSLVVVVSAAGQSDPTSSPADGPQDLPDAAIESLVAHQARQRSTLKGRKLPAGPDQSFIHYLEFVDRGELVWERGERPDVKADETDPADFHEVVFKLDGMAMYLVYSEGFVEYIPLGRGYSDADLIAMAERHSESSEDPT